jgi:ABC-type sulfate/molybdate transport systems ATPase subunit
MTVAENIEFGLKIRKIPSSERRKRSAELLDLVNLTGLGHGIQINFPEASNSV